ncbi:MAG: hypothetical protein LBT40_02225 [Deltaproteobacteria bacterium]|jgi:hypothetical protein|nr:hypothetical protein [Deltaproteobacteria bacterium]
MDTNVVQLCDMMTDGFLSNTIKELESKTSKLSFVISRAVLGFNSYGMSPEQISSTMALDLEEVIGVLRENGKLV